MRTEKKLLSSLVNFCLAIVVSTAPAPQNSRNFAEGKGKAEVTKFHVDTQIQFRYAITNIETQIRNRHDEAKEVSFDMVIPKDAFVSNFSMVIKGKTYQAKVETKEIAEQTFKKSTSTSGLLESNSLSEYTSVKQVTFSAKLDPTEKATFYLRYEEQLQRSEKGQYNYEVNIQPQNQKIPDFKIKVNINESLPLEEDLSVKRVKDKNVAKFQAEDITNEVLKNLSDNVALIEMTPNDAKNNGKDWKFVINYDVKRHADGNDVQIGAGKFVHYFAPDNLPSMKKHVIFVIDVSGSMSGRKLEQTKDAMTTMLTKMSEKNLDNFNIITFEDDVKVWQPDMPVSVLEQLFANESSFDEIVKLDLAALDLSFSIPKKNGSLSEAYDFVLDMSAGGGTNINEALLKAIEIAKDVKKREEIDSKTEQLIVFLTDGEPTSGQDYPPAIRRNIKEANADTQIPIYGLALGDGADFDLVKEISDENNGFAERIYESGNSFEQLEDFYNKISDPKLKDVTFEYLVNGEVIAPENLTSISFDKVFGLDEYSITGTLSNYEEVNEIEVKINAQTDLGFFEESLILTPCGLDHVDHPRSFPTTEDLKVIDIFRCFPYIPIPQAEWKQTPTEEFMERLWAFKRINYLLDDQNDCEKGIDDFANDELPQTTTEPSESSVVDILFKSSENDLSNGDKCKEEAIRLALKYNFVTDVTSMVVEEEDEYVNKGTVGVDKKVVGKSYDDYDNYYSRSSAYTTPPAYAYAASLGGIYPRSGSSSHSNIVSKSSYITSGRAPAPKSHIIPFSGGSNYYDYDIAFESFADDNLMSARSDDDSYYDDSYYYDSIPTLASTTTTSTTTTVNPICKMIMYDQTYFRGKSVEIVGDVSDFNDIDFDNAIASVKIEGNCCWALLTDANYKGDLAILNGPGEYQSGNDFREVFKKASSARNKCS